MLVQALHAGGRVVTGRRLHLHKPERRKPHPKTCACETCAENAYEESWSPLPGDQRRGGEL